MKILLVEDDPILSDLIGEYLSECGYDTIVCPDSFCAQKSMDKVQFDLFIFDINIPGKSGIELLKEEREFEKNTPAILITAYHDIEHLKKGFLAGCDDYIKKPFELEELGERINNIKKRYNIQSDTIIHIDEDVGFDFEKRELVFKDRSSISLSLKECEILRYLINRKNRVVSTMELIQNIWDYEQIPSDATLRVYIKNLRKHLSKNRIKTVRGSGYCFES